MGFFDKLLGAPDSAVMSSPLVGRGQVVGLQVSGMTMRMGNGLAERKCTFTVHVMLDNQPPYQTQCSQRVREIDLPRLASGSAVVAVRVDPKNRGNVAIDFGIPVPVITLPRLEGPTSGAWILANGKPITVVLVANVPMGLRSADGHDVQNLTLTVVDGVPAPYQVQVANAVPASALPLLYPGSKLHAKLGDQPNYVTVDWNQGAVKAV